MYTTTIPAKKRARKIRSVMALADVTNVKVAQKAKVTHIYVSNVINGQRVGRRIRKTIAEMCGVAYEELWPDDDGFPEAA